MILSSFNGPISAPLPPIIKLSAPYSLNKSLNSFRALNSLSDVSKLKPLGVNPPASDSNATKCDSLFFFASSAYLFPPLKPFSSFANNTTLIVLLGL